VQNLHGATSNMPAMVLVPSVVAAETAPPAAVGLPSARAPAEPMPCSGAPGAAENLPRNQIQQNIRFCKNPIFIFSYKTR